MRAVNLIPVDRRVGAGVGLGRSQGGAYALLGIVVLLALLVFLYGKATHQVSSDKAQAAKRHDRSRTGALRRRRARPLQRPDLRERGPHDGG